MKAIIIPLILICNLCFGQKEYNDDSCRGVRLDSMMRTMGTASTETWVTSTTLKVQIDTIPTILLFIETSKRNTARSCRWIHGYEVRVSSFPESQSIYLDYRKRRLPKNVIVFMSINQSPTKTTIMSVKSNRKIQTISLTDYCRNKNLRSGTPFIIRNGKGYHILGGVEVSRETFDKLYPIPSMLFYRTNSDHTKDFMNLP